MAKNISKIAAIALAGATAVSTLAISASAATVNKDGKLEGKVYIVTTTTTNADGLPQTVETIYATEDAAKAVSTTYSSVDVTTIGSTVYVSGGIISATDNGGTAYTTVKSSTTGSGTNTGNVVYSTPSSTYWYYSNTVYYSALTGMYYPNISAMQNVEGVHTSYTPYTTNSGYSSTNRFFDPYTGTYSSSSSSGYSYAVSGSTTSTNDATSIYKVNGYYYPTYSAAYSAANGNTSLINWVKDYTSAPTNYFSEVTGSFYSSYASALAASNGSSDRVTVMNGAYYDNYYDYYYNYLYGYNGYYGYYDYTDPYFLYFYNKNYSSSSSSKDTTTATLGKRKGWTSIAKYLKSVSSGSSATIDMNKETVIPSEVTAAIKGRNVTVKFVLDNGVTFTVNGKDVTTAKDVDVDTTYNTKSISTKLIKAAYKKNDAVSSAQLSIDAGTLGFNSDVTVKFSAKRGGYKAKLYRYNAAKNSLQLVDTATIGSTGKCNFDNVTKGGEFVVVIYK
ncbi:MAG: hypothetical protein IJ035_02050 [Oscillospiraceae bacterium]|nr:hypothetical protein [Oscillospiraceae bacterium]